MSEDAKDYAARLAHAAHEAGPACEHVREKAILENASRDRRDAEEWTGQIDLAFDKQLINEKTQANQNQSAHDAMRRSADCKTR